MNRLAIATALMVMGPLLACAAPIPKILKKKAISLEGNWQLQSMNLNGQSIGQANGQCWIIEGTECFIENNGQRINNSNQKYTMTRPEGEAENAVDWNIEYTGQGQSNYTYKGLFKIENDTFTFCFASNGNSGPRPEECEPGQNRYVYTFTRLHAEVKK